MNKNFKPGFTYQEFAPQFTAEHFDANEWAKLFEDSGARLVSFGFWISFIDILMIYGNSTTNNKIVDGSLVIIYILIE